MGEIVKYVNLFVQSEVVASTTTPNGECFIVVMMVVFIIYVVLEKYLSMVWNSLHRPG